MNRKIKKTTVYRVFAFCVVFCIVVLSFSALRSNLAMENVKADEAIDSGGRPYGRANFLLLGEDRASGLTDVMMLVSFDIDGGQISVVQIPRDTYARYPDSSHRKINAAMNSLGGAEALCSFISDAMRIDIEGYCLIDLDAFSEIVDSIGGVEIDLPFDMEYDDPTQGLAIRLKAGRQTLDGDTAEQFVRYRSGYVRGDLGRIDAQKLFVSAFVKKVSEDMTAASAMKLVMSMLGDVDTNISIGRMTELIPLVFELEAEDITMLTLPGADIRSQSSGAWYYVISRNATVRALREYMGSSVVEDEFDTNEVFVDSTDRSFLEIYGSDRVLVPSRVSDINENGISIQKR